ncbi:hypothetical protein [Devosia sp.]|uniref:hypothetical protein n=1 Tax=Devosia sp. TaxID=1871048 RepID=UPI003BAB2268
MDFKSPLAARFLKIVAIITLLLGLSDASRLLGVSTGATSPIDIFGPVGFAYLTTFCLARLFASVGLWIRASWGAVLLASSTITELLMYVLGSKDVQISPFGFAVRVVLVASITALFVLSLRMRRAHD